MLHAGEVVSVNFSNDGAFALTAAGNGTEGEVRLWDSATGLPIGPPARHDLAVTSVRFADDDRSFLTLCDDATARRWPMPQPVEDDAALVKLWVQTITGQEQDAGKAVSVLDAATWRERRTQVMDSPLAADLKGGEAGIPAWHDASAGAYEISGPWEPAFWHLDRLVAGPARRLVAACPEGGSVSSIGKGRRSDQGTRPGPHVGRTRSCPRLVRGAGGEPGARASA